MIDVLKIRKEFPILSEIINRKLLVYFDNAATTQKPIQVIDAINNFLKQHNSNIHRGVHTLSVRATEMYEESRTVVQKFVNAAHNQEIIFTKGATEAINLVAYSFGEKYVKEGDEVLVSEMEHHSNIVPWQMLCERKNAKLKYIPFDENGELIMDSLDQLLNEKTKIVSITHISNALGTVNPINLIVKKAHEKGIPVLIDGAQSVQHLTIDVQAIDCDFFVFSGHKIYADTGIGILYGKEKWLNEMVPYQGGGDMIETVSFAGTTYNKPPLKFEAGTPHFVGAISLMAAIRYIQSIGISNIDTYEKELLQYASAKVSEIEGLKIIGTAKNKASVLSFMIGNIHPSDIGTIVDQLGVAVRTGHHCAQPVMQHFGISGTVRASFSFYNTKDEIDVLYNALLKAKKMLEKN